MEQKAPGLKRRPNKDGTVRHYWVASAVSKHAKNYPLKTAPLFGSNEEIAQRCRILTNELKLWLSKNGVVSTPAYDGKISDLISLYRKTPESSYFSVKHNTRKMYDWNLDLLEDEVGDRRLDCLTGIDFRRWYKHFKAPVEEGAPERKRRAYGAIQLLRIIIKFGVTCDVLQCADDCVRLNSIIKEMGFEQPKARREKITFAQVQAFCKYAAANGRLSLAIAQAIQFELTMRQIDVIGYWEPLQDGENQQGIIDRRQRWSGGLLWNHIDADGVLEKETTKTGQEAVHDTTAYPFLRQYLDMVPIAQRIGPIVKDEKSGLPYRQRYFIDQWREIADAVGIPKNVWNMDSRAGGVTEGADAGANIEHLRHHANHSNIATTGRYDRKTLEKTRQVAALRVARREEKNG